MPKLNFCDTGLVCWLPGIRASDQLRAHPLHGPIFETWVTSEIAKRRANQGEFAGISHCRDRNGAEADPMVERPGGIIQPVSRRQPRSPTPRPFGSSMLHPRHPWRRPTPAPKNGHTAPLAGYARVRQGRAGLQRARRDHRLRLSKETTSSRSSPTDHAQKRYGHTPPAFGSPDNALSRWRTSPHGGACMETGKRTMRHRHAHGHFRRWPRMCANPSVSPQLTPSPCRQHRHQRWAATAGTVLRNFTMAATIASADRKAP